MPKLYHRKCAEMVAEQQRDGEAWSICQNTRLAKGNKLFVLRSREDRLPKNTQASRNRSFRLYIKENEFSEEEDELSEDDDDINPFPSHTKWVSAIDIRDTGILQVNGEGAGPMLPPCPSCDDLLEEETYSKRGKRMQNIKNKLKSWLKSAKTVHA